MLNNNIIRSDNRKGHQFPFTSVVILQKDSTGIVHACPVSKANIIGSRTYSVKSTTKRLSSSSVVVSRVYRKIPPSAISLSIKPKYWQGTLKVQCVSKPSNPVLLTSATSVKRLIQVLCILLTAGGILLITKPKKLITLANSLRAYLLRPCRFHKK
ncbi:hypothetical protein SAMN02746098_04817 [Desulfosporosinus lacus DSM 15449]|uniref:Uncharacterized protein n=1 Tax=Desulfosporosinus lacus DSM 15449 TaxID=1121420 RepID=A0A1M6EUM2_9FIRM|nr:hypothetical protein SAMN02746098_04817 [Desulfosporosinus lacus DSM 15449]